MGHDVHFLRRVDRLRSEHAELALGLYRDHKFVRYLLARLSVPERDQRVAIALGDDVRGPFVIVTREGRFVTCLGENMRLRGDETLVPRHRLDALSRHVSELRQLMEDARAGRNHQTKLLLQRVLDTGPSLSREEFVACSRWTPLAVHIFVDKLVMLNRTSRQLYERLRRVKSLSRKHAEAFTEFHRQSWAILHLTLLLGSDHGEALERVLSDLLPEPDRPPFARSVILCGMRQGTLSAVARSVWLSSKLPRLLLDQLRQDYASTCLLSLVLRYGMSLSALGLRHRRLNAKVTKTFHRCDLPDERKAAELGFRQLLAKTHDRVVEQQDALRARILEDALAVLKDVAEQEGEPLEEAPPTLLEDLAVPVLFAASDPLVGQDMVAPILFEWLPWIARANAPDFFAPEAYVAGRESSLNPEAGYLLVRVREMMEENHRFPVDQPERPGRNDPCSCGSGKKYKRCCG